MKETYKPDAGVFAIGLTKKEIKILVFWANVGLKKAKDGYQIETARVMTKYFKKELKLV